MNKLIATIGLILACVSAQAADISTTLTITNAPVTVGVGITASGPITLTNIGSGTFTATLGAATGTTLSAPFTITLTNGDKITGTLTIPATLLTGGNGNVSATITGGTGAFANATGSFPTLSGSTTGTLGLNFTLSVTGAGTITTGGTGSGGGTPPPPAGNTPTITDVLDAGSYTRNLAQGSIFVVKGTNLSASGFNQFQFPLPTTSGSVKISFAPTNGDQATLAYLVYLFNQNNVNQLAAILPSTLAAGTYNMTVTNNTGAVSAPTRVTVVQRKPGIITQDSTGSGLAVVQNFVSQSELDVNRFTTGTVSGVRISPAKPGQVLIAWLTGLGGVSGGDNNASPGFDFAANGVDVKVVVGGTTITPLYAGRAPGLAGADQINFVLPAGVQTGCTVPLQVIVAGVTSNTTFLSVAANATATACEAPGFTSQQLQGFDNGASFTVGSFSLTQISTTVPQLGNFNFNSLGGGFVKITGFQLNTASQYVASTNACQVFRFQTTSGQTSTGTPGPTGTVTYLDAGAITVNGPSGSNLSNTNVPKAANTNLYSLLLSGTSIGGISTGGVNANIVPGTYSLHGAGGNDVGVFDASISLAGALSITGGLPATIVRASGLPLKWTGGNASDVVTIIGSSSQTSGTAPNLVTDTGEFICTTTAGAGGFTVTPDILSILPPAPASANGTTGAFLEVYSYSNPVNGNGFFTAPLKAGGSIDAGVFLAGFGVSNTPVVQ